jgi:hypothetical protein
MALEAPPKVAAARAAVSKDWVVFIFLLLITAVMGLLHVGTALVPCWFATLIKRHV